MLVVSVVCLKGGVGKTSVTLGLAGAAWERGLRTLVLDLDPQGNASTVLDPESVRFSASDVLADPRPGLLPHAIAPAAGGRPSACSPPTRCSSGTTRSPAGTRPCGCGSRSAACTDWDLVLIDSPPSLAGLTRNALVASNYALVVAEPSLFAVQGAQAALEAIDLVRADNLRLRPAGIVVNKLRTQSTEHRFRLDELRSAYAGLVLEPPLMDRTAIQQAEGACVPVQAWRSPGAREVCDAFEDLLDQVLVLPSSEDGPLSGRVSPRLV